MFEAGPGDNDYRKSLCLLGVGLDPIGMDKPKDAIEPLESSVALQGSLGRPGWETDAALARALWDGGGDRRRACAALAQQAHDLLTPLSVRYGAQYKEEPQWSMGGSALTRSLLSFFLGGFSFSGRDALTAHRP